MDPEVARQIRALWNRFWSGGLANPLTAIEQISYLLFLRRLEEVTARRDASLFASNPHCRWSWLREQPPETMFKAMRDEVFPFLKSLSHKGGAFATSMADAAFVIPSPALLADAVRILDALPLAGATALDAQGDLYEDLLKELNLAGRNGQFRTGRHIIDTMVEVLAPRPKDWVCDPAAGTAGFLVAAWREMKRRNAAELKHLKSKQLLGWDIDPTMVRIGLMNMLLHGIEDPQLRYGDTLSSTFEVHPRFDVVLANPPFTGRLPEAEQDPRLTLQTQRTELLFLERCIQLMKPGGRAAIIVPEGVLFSSSATHTEIRRRLVMENRIRMIVSLPSGCFRPYTGVKTSILIFERGGQTDEVWFYDVTGDGYTLDDRRIEGAHNDLQFVPQAWRIRVCGRKERWQSQEAKETAERQMWRASSEQLIGRDYALTARAWRPLDDTASEEANPLTVLAEIKTAQQNILEKLATLEQALSPGGSRGA